MANDQNKPLRNCPRTGGRPVSMTRDGWDKVCAAARAEAHRPSGWKPGLKKESSLIVSLCLDCKGDIPAEVTIIELPNINKEEDMANDTRVPGTCDFCGRQKQVIERCGKKICAMCESLRCSIRSNPGMVVASLKELAPSALPAGGGSLTAELVKLRAERDKQTTLLEDRQHELEEATLELSKVKTMLQEALANPTHVHQLTGSLDISVDLRPAIHDLALRLAIGTMRGNVAGIDADDVELLRSV